MAGIIFYNNKILFRNSQIAMDTACCCDLCCCGENCASKPTVNAHFFGAGLDMNITLNCQGYDPPTPCPSASIWSASNQLLFNCPDPVRADMAFKCEYTGTVTCSSYKFQLQYLSSGCNDISGFRSPDTCSCSPFNFVYSIPAPSPNGNGGCDCGDNVKGKTITVTIT